MAHLLVSNLHERENEERQALNPAADASSEQSVEIMADDAAATRRMAASFSFRDYSQPQRSLAIRMATIAILFTILLITAIVLAVKRSEDRGDAAGAVLPIVLLASISLSCIVQFCRALPLAMGGQRPALGRGWASVVDWGRTGGARVPPGAAALPGGSTEEAGSPAERSGALTRRLPRDTSAEAQIAYALRLSLGRRAASAALDPTIVEQLRRAGMTEAQVTRVQLLMHEGDFRPEDYEMLLALDEISAEIETLTRARAAGGRPDAAGGSGEGRTGRGSRRARRARELMAMHAASAYNPSAAQPHELARLPTYTFQPKAQAVEVVVVPDTTEAAAPGPEPSKAVIPRAEDGASAPDGSPWCAICMDHASAGELIRILPCFHSFHQACVDSWLLQKATCPICKVSVRDPVWGAMGGEEG